MQTFNSPLEDLGGRYSLVDRSADSLDCDAVSAFLREKRLAVRDVHSSLSLLGYPHLFRNGTCECNSFGDRRIYHAQYLKSQPYLSVARFGRREALA